MPRIFEIPTSFRWLKTGALTACLLACSVTWTAPAMAQPAGNCAVPPGLGATLLFPYFEVDLGNTAGKTTVLSINNGRSVEVMARVVVWTDWGRDTLAFDVWLDAFDVQTLNMRSVFDGNIPSTGAGEGLGGFANCDNRPPSHANPAFGGMELAQLRADHLGVEGPMFGNCVGEVYGDGVARGYVTVDVVDECNGIEVNNPQTTPVDSDRYFDDGDGQSVAINNNDLWGDYTYLDFAGAAAQGSQAVPLWASESTFAGSDIYTFYGRFHNFDGRDHRVPLPFRWNQRFLAGGSFGGGADLIVWRDPELPTSPAACNARPAPFPLLSASTALDEAGNTAAGPALGFPIATQRVSIDDLNVPFDFGWIQVSGDVNVNGVDNRSQVWVETTLAASTLGFSASWPGTPVAFLCNDAPSTR